MRETEGEYEMADIYPANGFRLPALLFSPFSTDPKSAAYESPLPPTPLSDTSLLTQVHDK